MAFDEWDEPVESTAEFITPQKLANHLLIVFPIGYVDHIQTRFTRPDKPSDAIAVDVIDLDAVGDDGAPGKLYRNNNWMQAKLIQSLRPKIGGRMLAHMRQGMSSNGMNPPWILVSATGDPDAVKRGDAWVSNHPEYRPTEFVIREQRAQPAAQGRNTGGQGMYNPHEDRQGYNDGPSRPQGQWDGDPRTYQGPPPEWSQEQPPDPWANQAPQGNVGVRPPTPEELSVLERMRQQRANQQQAPQTERQQYGY